MTKQSLRTFSINWITSSAVRLTRDSDAILRALVLIFITHCQAQNITSTLCALLAINSSENLVSSSLLLPFKRTLNSISFEIKKKKKNRTVHLLPYATIIQQKYVSMFLSV